ncbi:MAG TPA: type 4a pilus biogenesis protein PilO [Candidatus Paceibacterota bacterium]|nr:type 4a pilus biogenesis protein PilO [Candidatus Paceibacterota bacterium]
MNSSKLLFPILLIIAAGLIFYLFINPTYANVNNLKQERAQYDTALGDAAQLQEKLQSLREQLNSFSPDELTRLDHMLPNHVDNVRLILELNAIAARNNMVMKNINFALAPDASGNANSPSNSQTKEVQTVGVSFSVKGDYHTLIAFLQDLERSLRMIDIESVNFSVPQGSTADSSTYTYSIVLHTYWLNY